MAAGHQGCVLTIAFARFLQFTGCLFSWFCLVNCHAHFMYLIKGPCFCEGFFSPTGTAAVSGATLVQATPLHILD